MGPFWRAGGGHAANGEWRRPDTGRTRELVSGDTVGRPADWEKLARIIHFSPACALGADAGAGALPLRPQDLALTCQDRAKPRAELGGRGREDPSPNRSRPPERRSGCFPAVPYPSSGPLSFYTPSLFFRLTSSGAADGSQPARGIIPAVARRSQEALWAAW
jgi:hypothetical protein